MDPAFFYSRLKSYYTKSSPRSRVIAKNVLLGGSAKGLAFIVNLIQIPLILRLISPLEYGVWLTLYAIVGWFSFFDIGLGNGLRNKLAHALAKNDQEAAKRAVSTAYVALGLIFGGLTPIIGLASFFINWQKLLNTGPEFTHSLGLMACIAIVGVLLNLAVNLIHSVLAALQKTGISSYLLLLTQLAILLLSWGLTFYKRPSFLYLVIILSFTPLLINLIGTFWLFQQPAFANIRPSIHFFDKNSLKDIGTLGYQFFIIQIAAIILFSTDSFLISHLFSPQEVIPYFLTFKYFSVVTLGFSIISPPIWSGFSHAYALKDTMWIRATMTKLFYLWGLIVPIIVIMVLFSNTFYQWWFGNRVVIPFDLTLTFGVYSLVAVWNSILSVYVNGTGELKLQFRIAIIGAVLNIPLSVYLANYWGLIGVPWATILCQLIGSITLFYQYKQPIRT
ncbi:MAG: polysaccharide biosynthesis C-terminal domain-containing protein [Spirosomataceae bacterium]